MSIFGYFGGNALIYPLMVSKPETPDLPDLARITLQYISILRVFVIELWQDYGQT